MNKESGDATSYGSTHIPVLVREIIGGVSIQPGSEFVDGTIGGGGHTNEILKKNGPNGRVLGLDADPAAIERVGKRFPDEVEAGRLVLVNTNFVEIEEAATDSGFNQVDGILLDLGVSSFQIDEPERGFSFQYEGPLDMRMDSNQSLSAAVIVNQWSEKEIADVIYRYGEERKSRRIARSIVKHRPIRTTTQLAETVSRTVGGRRGRRIHPATRTFQALRIAVNEELTVLEDVLPQCLRLLGPVGRLAVISFHSLEDRIVKRWMQSEAADYVSDPTHPMGGVSKRPTIRILTRKPLTPTDEEVASNPRSRSAKLRIAEKVFE